MKFNASSLSIVIHTFYMQNTMQIYLLNWFTNGVAYEDK